MKHSSLLSLSIACLSAGVAPAMGFPEPNPFPYPFEPMPSIYKQGWIDLNKNGAKDVYEDPKADLEARLDDLLSQMTREEKAMQLLTLYAYPSACKDKHPTKEWKTRAWKDGIANVDQAGDAFANGTQDYNKTPERNARYINNLQRFFVEQTRLGIPADMTNEGIRGANVLHGTSFPSPHSQGMMWDPALAYEIGRVMGSESKAVGYTNVYGPILDVARDQRWGRWEGTIAEDPFLVAETGKQIAKGLQDVGVASSPKHFVGYGENKGARGWDSRTDPHITAQTFEAIHMYPFRRVFSEVGPLGVMCAYNDVNGVPVASSADLLKKRLREEFGFKGYVVSDSGAVERLHNSMRVAKDLKEAHAMRVSAGLNVWTNFAQPENPAKWLVAAMEEGTLPMADVDEAVRDVLRVKFLLGLFDKPYVESPAAADNVVGNEAFQKVALQAVRECLVLLKNEGGLLPLDAKKLKRVAVIGPNADSTACMPTHYGPRAFKSVTVLKGIQAELEGMGIDVAYAKGCDHTDPGWPDSELIPEPLSAKEQKELDAAVALAKTSDVAIVVLGDSGRTSGESRTRNSLNLPGRQEALLRAVQATGKPVVLVLLHGRPPAVNFAHKYVPAILSGGFPGGHGGTAIAEALFGKYNPGGKTNGTWLRSAGQIPYNFPAKPRSNEEPNARGRSHYDGPLWPFGYGLSYTTFDLGKPKAEPVTTSVTVPAEGFFASLFGKTEVQTSITGWRVTLPVTNTGKVAGDEVVQLYVAYTQTPRVSWFDQMLRGFRRVHLNPGETKDVVLEVDEDGLKIALDDQSWVLPEYPFELRIGTSSQHIRYRILVKDGKVVKVETVDPKAKPRENLNPLSA